MIFDTVHQKMQFPGIPYLCILCYMDLGTFHPITALNTRTVSTATDAF